MITEKMVIDDHEKCPSCGNCTQTREVHPTESKMIWICKRCNWVSGQRTVCSVDYMKHLRKILSEKKS